MNCTLIIVKTDSKDTLLDVEKGINWMSSEWHCVADGVYLVESSMSRDDMFYKLCDAVKDKVSGDSVYMFDISKSFPRWVNDATGFMDKYEKYMKDYDPRDDD